MFKVVAERRKRSVWSPRTIAASVVFHLLLLAGFVSAAGNTHKPERERIIDISLAEPVTPKPVAPDPAPPPPAPEPDRPQPVRGQTIQLPAPETVPTTIPEPDPHATPVTAAMTTGIGPVGDVFGKPDSTRTTPAGATEVLPVFGDGPIDADKVDELPELANRREAERQLQRAYPPLLRDAGVSGHTTVMVIIDENGNVEPGSARVQDATHDGFRDAAVRAVERFHFRPATLKGRKVPVLISIPIDWRLES